MPHRVATTARAERDFWTCHDDIRQRNPAGADRWVEAFEPALLSLEQSPHRGLAPEGEVHAEEIRQVMFKTPLLPGYFELVSRTPTP